MVKIKAYSVGDLRRMLDSGPFFAGNPVPITRERALSQVNNPRAEDSDMALLVAYDAEVVVAHLGILPDLAFVGVAERKIGWLTAWWANPDHKYSGLGMLLMMRAMALYKNGVGASGFSEDAKKVYAATRKFTTIKELPGISAFTRFDVLRILPKRFQILGKVNFVLEACDAVANCFIGFRQVLWKNNFKIPDGVRVEAATELDAEAGQFVSQHNQGELTRREAKELNWIGKYPWMTCVPSDEAPPFQLPTTASSFCSRYLKIHEAGGELVAVVMLTVIDGHLIIPSCHHAGCAELVARVIGHEVATQKVKRITTYRGELVAEFLRMRFPWVWSKQKTRSWILSGSGVTGDSIYSVQDGDGDCAFTV
jgi:hypothetical protein